jgi:hypothetical protein
VVLPARHRWVRRRWGIKSFFLLLALITIITLNYNYYNIFNIFPLPNLPSIHTTFSER